MPRKILSTPPVDGLVENAFAIVWSAAQSISPASPKTMLVPDPRVTVVPLTEALAQIVSS